MKSSFVILMRDGIWEGIILSSCLLTVFFKKTSWWYYCKTVSKLVLPMKCYIVGVGLVTSSA